LTEILAQPKPEHQRQRPARSAHGKAKVEGKGVEKAYSVDIDLLYALRGTRKSSGKRPRKVRESYANTEDFAELIRDLTAHK
jgi:hypothetical protein